MKYSDIFKIFLLFYFLSFNVISKPTEIPVSTIFENSDYIHIEIYKKAIKEILASSESEDFFSKEGYCLDYSMALYIKLQQMGFKNIKVMETRPYKLSYLEVQGQKSKERADKIHFFLTDNESVPDTEIIIDPTYLQFFKKVNLISAVSPIFVGDQKSLFSFYQENQKLLGWEIFDGEPTKTGVYNSREIVCMIYSIGECSVNRSTVTF